MKESRPRSIRVLTLLAVGATALLWVGLIGIAEVGFRLRGHEPYGPKRQTLIVEPNQPLYEPDPKLGYHLAEGTFRVQLEGGESFRATHDAEGRVTPGTPPLAANGIPLWIFGCSFTYGWGIHDDETFTSRLQGRFPQAALQNFGVGGYGTTQMVLQFEKKLKERAKPRVAVLTYASFQDSRSTYLPSYQRYHAQYNHLGAIEMPYARVDQKGQLALASRPVPYPEIPLMRYSSIISFLEKRYRLWEERGFDSHRVAESLILRFRDDAESAGIIPVLADLSGPFAKTFAERVGLRYIDLSLPPTGTFELSDGHPNAEAHQRFADTLGDALAPLLKPQETPKPQTDQDLT